MLLIDILHSYHNTVVCGLLNARINIPQLQTKNHFTQALLKLWGSAILTITFCFLSCYSLKQEFKVNTLL